MTAHVLVCSGKKKSIPCKAIEMYSPSTFFSLGVEYAKLLDPSADILILSAKHGVLHESDSIEPYDLYLSNLPAAERKLWGQKVAEDLNARGYDTLLLQTTENYWKYVKPYLSPSIKYQEMLPSLRFGKRLAKYKELISERIGFSLPI